MATKATSTAGNAAGNGKVKSKLLEPRGRPAAGQPLLSGATADDPLVSVQILKVRKSVWEELGQAAREQTWHRSVLVRKILDEWIERRQLSKKRKEKQKAA